MAPQVVSSANELSSVVEAATAERKSGALAEQLQQVQQQQQRGQLLDVESPSSTSSPKSSSLPSPPPPRETNNNEPIKPTAASHPGEQLGGVAHKKKKNRKLRSQGNINDESTSSPKVTPDAGSGEALEANVTANSKAQSSQDKAQEIEEEDVAAARSSPGLQHSLALTGTAAPAPHTVIECAAGAPVPDQQQQQQQNQVSSGSVKSDSKSTPDECQVTLDTSVQNCSSIALLPLDDSPINSPSAAGNQQQQQQTRTDNNHQSLAQNANKSQDSKQQEQQQQQQQRKSGNSNKRPSVLFEGQERATAAPTNLCKQRRLSYLQSLLLRRWPCLAIGICIMSSLLFGMLLSVLTVYLMHGVTDCSNLALAAAAAANAAGNVNSPLLSPHELRRLNLDLEGNPFEMAASLTAGRDAEIFGRQSNSGGGGGGGSNSASGSGNLQVSTLHRFQRLPNSLWPIHYDLFVQPYIAEPFNFSGKVSIRIKCSEATDNITLHTLDLELDERSLSLKLAAQNSSSSNQQVKVASTSTSAPKVKGLSQDKQLQYSIIHLDSPLEVGLEYVLGIDFSGLLNDDLAGFYKIRFERQNSSETTWIAATQFQATDARRAFPCFDEPLYKATFSIQIKHWKNMTALSNMPIIDRQDSPDGLWVTDTFSKSHRMSTYLVAYAITNFESRSEGNISVWTRPGFAHSAEYALKIAGKILRHYEDFFGIEYPLPKMDMIALPDFNAGAMENWGLITYRETAMLWDENSSSVGNKQRVAVVVAHELAHQWFGNLVTPKWWDDLWLNEGFASYVEYIGVDHVEPTWRMLDQFVVEEVQNVFKLDGLSSSHQISIPVNNPDEISEIFDHISYAKGASIIRMMNHFLTEQVFKAGLRRYLSALRYSNAEQSDLWAHLTEAYQQLGANKRGAGVEPINVERVMNSWTLQVGFPLVTLTRSYGNSRRALLEQQRYQPYKTQLALNSATASTLNSTTAPTVAVTSNQEISSKLTSGISSGQQQQHHKQQQRWEIPITFTSKSEQNWQPNTRLWMHQNDSQPVEINKDLVPKSDDDWMLLNVNQVGYYRVNYDLRNWRLLINQLNTDHSKISTTNRAQILDDIFELARTGLIDYVFAMEATKYLKIEREYLPWDTVLMSFSYIDDMLQRTPLYGDWKDYIADLISPYYARYRDTDWTMGSNKVNALNAEQQLNQSASSPSSAAASNDVLEQYNQVNAIHWACQVNEHCIQKAKSNFYQWKKTGRNHIEPALRYTVYCSAIENGNKDDWDFLWKIYEGEQNAQERDRIMRALGCTREIWLLSRYLDWTFSKTKAIRRQDGAYVFKMIAKNNYGRDVAFNFMRERWSTIKEYYGKSSFSLGNLIRSIATSMNTQVELSQLIAFYESIKGDVGTGKRAFQIAMEEAESNVLWRSRNYRILEEWIHDARGGKTTAKMAIH